MQTLLSTENKNPRRRKARNGDFCLLNCPPIILNPYSAATSSAASTSSVTSPASSAASSFGVASSAGATGVWFSSPIELLLFVISLFYHRTGRKTKRSEEHKSELP